MGVLTTDKSIFLKRNDYLATDSSKNNNIPTSRKKSIELPESTKETIDKKSYRQKYPGNIKLKPIAGISLGIESRKNVEYGNKQQKQPQKQQQQQSQHEIKLKKPGLTIQLRQLPCKTFISCGDCPYRDKCSFIHDISLASKGYISKNNLYNDISNKNDSFFWKPMPFEQLQKQYSANKGDIFQPYIPSKLHSESKYVEYAVKSLWSNLSDYCKEVEDQRDASRRRNKKKQSKNNADINIHSNSNSTTSHLNVDVGTTRSREVESREYNDVTGMNRCDVFVQLAKGKSILPTTTTTTTTTTTKDIDTAGIDDSNTSTVYTSKKYYQCDYQYEGGDEGGVCDDGAVMLDIVDVDSLVADTEEEVIVEEDCNDTITTTSTTSTSTTTATTKSAVSSTLSPVAKEWLPRVVELQELEKKNVTLPSIPTTITTTTTDDDSSSISSIEIKSVMELEAAALPSIQPLSTSTPVPTSIPRVNATSDLMAICSPDRREMKLHEIIFQKYEAQAELDVEKEREVVNIVAPRVVDTVHNTQSIPDFPPGLDLNVLPIPPLPLVVDATINETHNDNDHEVETDRDEDAVSPNCATNLSPILFRQLSPSSKKNYIWPRSHSPTPTPTPPPPTTTTTTTTNNSSTAWEKISKFIDYYSYNW